MENIFKLGESEYKLRFKLGVLKHLTEISGQDGISFLQTAGVNVTFGMYALLLAAIKCYDDKHKVVQVTPEKLMEEVNNEAEIEQFNELVSMYSKFLNPSGEGQAKEETPSPLPGFKN